jgi:hypothetical protein
MKSIEEILNQSLAGVYNQEALITFQRLKDFIDATLSDSLKSSEENRVQFLILNLLKVRDALAAEISESVIKVQLKNNIMKTLQEEIASANQEKVEEPEPPKKKEDAQD